MGARAAWLVVAALAAGPGCRKEPRGAPEAGPAAAAPAPADAAPDPCVAACVRDNQARATSIEQIEAECRAACAADAAP